MKKILTFILFIILIWFGIPPKISNAVEDIEHITVYGTYYPMDWMWERMEFEIYYSYYIFHDEYYFGDERQALVAACQAVQLKRPNDCTTRPSALASPRTNGCSIPSGAPYESWSNTFSSACNAHDICYDNLSSPKSSCDGAFSYDLDELCDGIMQSGIQKTCFRAAGTYYSGVVVGGAAAYYTSNIEAKCAAWWGSYDKTCGQITRVPYQYLGVLI